MKHFRKIFFFTLPLLIVMGFAGQATPKTAPVQKTNGAAATPELRTIRRVSVHGHYPYLAKKILRLSSLQPGDVFHPELLEESRERLRLFFEKEGYAGTTVAITAEPDEKFHAERLKINIAKGKLKRIGVIEVTGNPNMNTGYVKNRLLGLGMYKPARIKKRLQKVEQKYVTKGFVRAQVKISQALPDESGKKMNLTIPVEERKKLTLVFNGNKYFSADTLKSLVTFYRERGYDSFAVERSTAHLLDFYHLNGFMDIAIESQLEKSKTNVQVTFTINEGPKTRLKHIRFNGNNSFSDGKLAGLMTLQTHTMTTQGLFRTEPIPDDMKRLEAFYKENGFFEAHVDNWQMEKNSFGDQAILTINISEGEPTIVDSIVVTGNHALSSEEVVKKINLKSGKRYDQQKIAKAQEKLFNTYLALGHPYFNLQVEKNPGQNHHLNLVFKLEEGEEVKIGTIRITGNFTTKQGAFDSAIKFHPGDLYIYRKILEGQLNLKRLGIFDYVRLVPQGLEQKANPVDIVISVQESKTITLDLQAGFDSDKLASGQILFTKRNLFGLAKQIQFRGIGGFQLDRAEMTLFSPRVGGARMNLVNQYFGQYENRPNFNAISYGGSLGFLKQYGPSFTLLVKEQITRLNIIENKSNQTALAGNLFDSTFSELSSSAGYDTRNNFADPSKGFYSLLSSEFDTDLAHPATNFQISRFNFANYLSLNNQITLINNLRVGKIFRINNADRIPANKLFFMGGNDTLRGFAEDAIDPSGGTTSIIYNAEIHFRLFDSLKLAGFFDAGSLTETFSQINRDKIRDSAGVGLRYMTPVGPIRADYGFVLDKKPGEAGRRFHFSFGYFF